MLFRWIELHAISPNSNTFTLANSRYDKYEQLEAKELEFMFLGLENFRLVF